MYYDYEYYDYEYYDYEYYDYEYYEYEYHCTKVQELQRACLVTFLKCCMQQVVVLCVGHSNVDTSADKPFDKSRCPSTRSCLRQDPDSRGWK